MARFYPLQVTDIRNTIRDAVVVTLKPQPGTEALFDFVQGQYLTFRRCFDGQEIRRSYSICSGLDDGRLEVGIKRVDGGVFSTWANTALKPGDRIDAMAPMGQFHTQINPKQSQHYLGFAGGSGITPVMSILKTVLAREPGSRFTLVFANRGLRSIMLREELEDLKNLYLGRLAVIHILEDDAQEIDLFTGRVTEDKCQALFAGWIDITSVDTAFICGPEPMMLGIASALKTAGLTDEQIKFELFGTAQHGRMQTPRPPQETTGASSPPVTAHITLDGATQTITFDRATSLLDAARAQSIDVPFACKAGVCSTCRCRVIDGEVDMRTNHALEDYEVAKGYVLSCQSYAMTEVLVVDYDQ